MDFTWIDNDDQLDEMSALWNRKERIAMDFEGEFNLHIYGEHLCLIQVNDGDGYYIIDPRSPRLHTPALVSFLSSPVKKVWFDCQSDMALVYKKYGCQIASICDIRVYALALGWEGNLLGLEGKYLGLDSLEGLDKKKLQQTNWLRRPLSQEQTDYALLDVAHLMELEDILRREVEEKGLARQCDATMRHLKAAEPKPGWTKLGDWRRMTKEQKEAMKQYYIARETVAKRSNVPAFRVLDKHVVLRLGLSCPRTQVEVLDAIKEASPRFKSHLEESMLKAFRILHP